MLRTDSRLIQRAQHHVRIVPKLARSAHPLLHIHVGAAEFLYLLLKGILHEMAPWLILLLHMIIHTVVVVHYGPSAAPWHLLVLVIQRIICCQAPQLLVQL